MKLLIQYGTKKEKIEVDDNCTMEVLKFIVSNEFDIPMELLSFSIMNKPINCFDYETLTSVGIKNMTMVKVSRLDTEEVKKEIKQAKIIEGYIPPIEKNKWIVVKRKMDADNSCLFHCLEYLFYNKSEADPYHIRKEVSEIVQLYPRKFTTDYLGQPNSLYAKNILDTRTWGSNVEISIYSFLKSAQIIVFDLENMIDVTYGDKSLNRCCFILFTGNHFDVLCLTKSLDPDKKNDMVLFNNTDKEVRDKMKTYIKYEYPSFHFTF